MPNWWLGQSMRSRPSSAPQLLLWLYDDHYTVIIENEFNWMLIVMCPMVNWKVKWEWNGYLNCCKIFQQNKEIKNTNAEQQCQLIYLIVYFQSSWLLTVYCFVAAYSRFNTQKHDGFTVSNMSWTIDQLTGICWHIVYDLLMFSSLATEYVSWILWKMSFHNFELKCDADGRKV